MPHHYFVKEERHWLADILRDDAPVLLDRLPRGFRTGQPLPNEAPPSHALMAQGRIPHG